MLLTRLDRLITGFKSGETNIRTNWKRLHDINYKPKNFFGFIEKIFTPEFGDQTTSSFAHLILTHCRAGLGCH